MPNQSTRIRSAKKKRGPVDIDAPADAGSKSKSEAATRTGDRMRMPKRQINIDPIEDLQILAPDGTADADLDPNLPAEQLKKIHRAMVLTRKLDIRMLNMQRQGEMGTFAPGYGQEATQIGQVYPLTADDWYSPSYRSFGAQVWRGWPMDQLLLLWAGFFEGFPPPEGVNDLPFSIVIGSHVPLAVGVGMGMSYRDKNTVMLVNFGDGAASEGDVSEAMNFAAVFKSPTIFVCENNGWAISTPIERQTGSQTFAQRGVAFGIPSIRVDGNDVLAMIVATREAVERGRRGEGPSFIEAVTYRMSLHTTADDPKVYRDEAEVKEWEKKCPIARFERYLQAKKILTADDCTRIADECEQEVLEAREKFRKRAVPKPREVFDYMYEELPPELEAQKREYLARLDRKGVE